MDPTDTRATTQLLFGNGYSYSQAQNLAIVIVSDNREARREVQAFYQALQRRYG